MNLEINRMSKPQITFSKCRTRDDLIKLLFGICIVKREPLLHDKIPEWHSRP